MRVRNTIYWNDSSHLLTPSYVWMTQSHIQIIPELCVGDFRVMYENIDIHIQIALYSS